MNPHCLKAILTFDFCWWSFCEIFQYIYYVDFLRFALSKQPFFAYSSDRQMRLSYLTVEKALIILVEL